MRCVPSLKGQYTLFVQPLIGWMRSDFTGFPVPRICDLSPNTALSHITHHHECYVLSTIDVELDAFATGKMEMNRFFITRQRFVTRTA